MSRKSAIVFGCLAAYRKAISPLFHSFSASAGACRFQPTCSEYAALAISQCGILRGGLLALRRLLRCNPLYRGGFDPVPGTWNSGHADPSGCATVSRQLR